MCFSVDWILHIIIVCIVIGTILALLRLLVATVLPKLGWPAAQEVASFVLAAIKIVIIAVLLILAVLFIGELISCLWNMSGGLSLPRVR